MPTQSITIDRYTYRIASCTQGGDAVIHLYDERSNLVGTVRGMADDSPLPAAEREGDRHFLYCPRSVIPELIDMLRNEGPVYLVWGDGIEPALSTAFEPVGEGEPARGHWRKR